MGRKLKENESYLYFEDENNFVIVNKRNAITYSIENGNWFENEYNENGKEISYKDSNGNYRKRSYNKKGIQIEFKSN